MSRRNQKKAPKQRKPELANYEISGYTSDGLVILARPDTTTLSPEIKKKMGFRFNVGKQAPAPRPPRRGKS